MRADRSTTLTGPGRKLANRLAEAMAERWTSPHGEKNPDWDIDGPDDATNPYCLPRPMAERVQQSACVAEMAADGFPSIAPLSIAEISDVVVELLSTAQFRDLLGDALGEGGPLTAG